MPWLINAAQVDKFRKSQKNVAILDASWFLPQAGRDPKAEFLAHHIIGARFFDFKDFHDPNTNLPNMLLRDEKQISAKLGALGISNDHKIIFYDNSDLHTSCRALWMLKVFGHNPNQLYILDGGYHAWETFGGKIEQGEPRAASPKAYQVKFEPSYIRALMQMKANLRSHTEQVIDARHPVRYAGGPEARPDMRPGHIPGSFSFPYMTVFENDGRFKAIDKIQKQLTGIGVSLNAPIVTSCGSGMTACILNFVLDLMGQNKNALYDGSWSEWGSKELYQGEESLDERPVETSLEK